MDESKTTETQVELGDRVKGQIELPSIDISPYIGKKFKIESVKEFEGKFGYYIKISTGIVETIKRDGLDDIELRASRTFSLGEDTDGNLGWNDKTKLGVYLNKMKVDHYKDLVGKEVTGQSVTSDKDGKDYLTFN